MKKIYLPILSLTLVALCLCSCSDRSLKGDVEGNKIARNGEVVTIEHKEDDTKSGSSEELSIYDEKRIANASKWDGNLQSVTKEDEIYDFPAGIGTKNEPYLLKSAEDVAHLAANVRYVVENGWQKETPTCYEGKYFRLECDIDMQGKGWYGIGGGTATYNDDAMFCGIFDGNGHAIYNFAMADEPMKGFFSYIGRGAVIKNLYIASGNIEVSNTEPFGVLVGAVRYGATIENCSVCVNFVTARAITPTAGLVGVVETSEDNRDLSGMFRDLDVTGCTHNGGEYIIQKVAKINIASN